MATPTRDAYWLEEAKRYAEHNAECLRREVGAIIVRDGGSFYGTSVSAGSNGSKTDASCLDGFCPRAMSTVEPGSSYSEGPGRCIAVHAEMMACLAAGRAKSYGATIYTTHEPCYMCRIVIVGAGLARVVWPEGEYRP